MQFGITMFGDLRFSVEEQKMQAPKERLKEMIEEIKLMDEVGLDYFGLGEHHRDDYAVSAPEIILAAASIETKNIILGSAVSVLSSSDPVKLFQDFSTIDQLSDGRVEVMAGRGSFIESFPLFGYELENYNELFEEKLDLLIKLNQQNPITWNGQFRASLKQQFIFPRPQQDQLPIWIAVGGTPESIDRAAKLGLPVMFAIIGGNYKEYKPLFDYYRQSYQAYGHDMSAFQMGVHMHSFFVDDEKDLMQIHYPNYAAQIDRIGKSRGWPRYSIQRYAQGRSKQGHLVIGDVSYTQDKILDIIETFGLTRFAAHLDTGAARSHLDMMRTIEIYGTKVIPEVKKSLKK